MFLLMTDPGSLFMLGIYGRKPTRRSVSLLRGTGASSVLLLARNIESPRQVRTLIRGLQDRLGRRLLFAVDHEGGWVLRFAHGVTAFPGNAALGKAADPGSARAVGRHMGRELTALGIGLNLAPVLDVVDGYNPGIVIRSFGSDPRAAGRLGAAMIRGMQEEGLSACAKHFPGKGAARVDAHLSLPTVRLPRATLERRHIAPFAAAIRAGVDCVMTSHAVFPALDKSPATFSRPIIFDRLRRRLGFRGVVISDDLCMGAVTEKEPVPQAAVRALAAGHDLLIAAHAPQAQLESVELCRAALAAGRLDAAAVDAGARRVQSLLRPRRAGRPSAAAARALAERISSRCVSVAQRGLLPLPWKPNGKPPLVVMPDFREVRERFTFEGGPRAPEALVRRRLMDFGRSRLVLAPVESKNLGRLEEAVREATRILFLCFEARRFPGQAAALRVLKARAPERTCVCLIRNPWDLELLDPRMTAVDSKGYRAAQLDAALDLVLGGP